MAIKSDSYLGSLFGLEGKTIVVTGAGGGIGLAISEGLLRAGAQKGGHDGLIERPVGCIKHGTHHLGKLTPQLDVMADQALRLVVAREHGPSPFGQQSANVALSAPNAACDTPDKGLSAILSAHLQ